MRAEIRDTGGHSRISLNIGVQPEECSGETLEALAIPKGAPRDLERDLGQGRE